MKEMKAILTNWDVRVVINMILLNIERQALKKLAKRFVKTL
jgi:hypothetical protein